MLIQTPGVHIKEAPGPVPAIAGGETGVLGVVGRGAHGPMGQSITVRSAAEYEGRFVDFLKPTALDAAVADFFAQGGRVARVVRVEDNPARQTPQRSEAAPFLDGLDALGDGEPFDLLGLALAGEDAALAHRLNGAALELACERRAFLLLEPVPGWTAPPASQRETFSALGLEGLPMEALRNAAVFWPPLRRTKSGDERPVAHCGALAGLFARIDGSRGVWKAPAGLEAVLAGLTVDREIDEAGQQALLRAAVNPIRRLSGDTVAWGARTLAGHAGSTDEFRHVSVRRLALFIEEAVERDTRWAVFEPNDEPLWARMRQAIGAFMDGLFRQGALAGSRPEEAWSVACGPATMTSRDQAEGLLRTIVGFAPARPGDFVLLSFEQRTIAV